MQVLNCSEAQVPYKGLQFKKPDFGAASQTSPLAAAAAA
eukprot:COSAG05_NODE_21561_length_271_cov_0.581395_1_plen_38_part_10